MSQHNTSEHSKLLLFAWKSGIVRNSHRANKASLLCYVDTLRCRFLLAIKHRKANTNKI